MLELRDSQSGTSNPMSEEDILGEVLGHRQGHNRGRGRKLPGVASSSSSAQSQPKMYTQSEVDKMFATANSQFSQVIQALQNVNIPCPPFQPIDPHQFVDDEESEEDDDNE